MEKYIYRERETDRETNKTSGSVTFLDTSTKVGIFMVAWPADCRRVTTVLEISYLYQPILKLGQLGFQLKVDAEKGTWNESELVYWATTTATATTNHYKSC